MQYLTKSTLLTCSALLCLSAGLSQAAPASPAAFQAVPVADEDEQQPVPELRGVWFGKDGGSVSCDFLVGDEQVWITFDHSLDTDTEGRIYNDGKMVEFDSEAEAKLLDIFARFLDAALTDEEIQGLGDGTLGFTDFDTDTKRNAAMFYGIHRGYLQLKAGHVE